MTPLAYGLQRQGWLSTYMPADGTRCAPLQAVADA